MTTPLQNSLEIFMTDVQRLQEENEKLKEQLETQKGLVEVYRESDSRLQRAVDKYKEQLQQAQNEKPAAIVGTRYCLKCGIESSYYFIDGFCNPCNGAGIVWEPK